MLGDPCTRDISDIHAYIKSVWPHRFLKRVPCVVKDLKKILFLLNTELGKILDVAARNDHKMTVVVRIFIENQGVVGAAKDDKILFVFSLPE